MKSYSELARLHPTKRNGGHPYSQANNNYRRQHWNQPEEWMRGERWPLWNESLRVNHEDADTHQYQCQPAAKTYQQDQAQCGVPQSNGTEHEHEGRGARNKPAAHAERDQT